MIDNSKKRKGKEIATGDRDPRRRKASSLENSQTQPLASCSKSDHDLEPKSINNKNDQNEYIEKSNMVNESDITKRETWVLDHYGPRDPRKVLDATFNEYSTYYGKKSGSLTYLESRKLHGEIYEKWQATLHRHYDQIVFTAGLKAKGLVTYAAYYGYQDPQNVWGQLIDDKPLTEMELYAIFKALLADKFIYSSLRVETSSMSALREMRKLIYDFPKCKYPTICGKIITLLSQRPGPISFGYVPLCAGIPGSDIVKQIVRNRGQNYLGKINY